MGNYYPRNSQGLLSGSEKLQLRGGKRLSGEVTVQGAKNAVLPIIAATAAARGTSVLHGCPHLSDVDAACRILRSLGCSTKREGGSVIVNADTMANTAIPPELMSEMRSSIFFLGAVLARAGECRMTMPGGCVLGPRPIDLHIDALRKMGVTVTDERGALVCKAENGIRGAKIMLPFPSVGATENIILTAVLADGDTEILNAAREPEIQDLSDYLIKRGAKIYGAGTGTINITGVSELLDEVEYKIIPDRIAAITYLCAAAITRGSLILRSADINGLGSFLPLLEKMGCSVYTYNDSVFLNAEKPLTSCGKVITAVYPGFPTDAQAPLMALACTLAGTTMFVENIFQSRFAHVTELVRLGAKIDVEGKAAVVQGVAELHGGQVCCTDLRGGAALVVAGLAAEGVTTVSDIYHIDRGYENIEGVLSAIGATIRRI